MKTKQKILMVSHGASATGFSRVAHGIINHLKNNFDFHLLAINHKKENVDGDFPIYGNPDYRDAYGLDRLTALTTKLNPDIIFILNDLWFCCMHIERLRLLKKPPITIAYCPIDGIITRPNQYQSLAHFDQVVAYNQFGKKALETINKEADKNLNKSFSRPITVINHGIDSNVFSPLNESIFERSKAKSVFFKDQSLQDSFIVLNASKHQLRKRIDLTIEGFALFAKNKPKNVKLYLHTGASFDGPDLRTLIKEKGIIDRVITSSGWLDDHPAINEEQLNLLYNATDVGINTSTGEGWGLISFEHALTGAPQIIPKHTACNELWKGLNTLLPIHHEYEHRGLGMLRKEVSVHDVASQLEQLYNDKNYRQEQALKSQQIALNQSYKWNEVAKQWNKIFQSLLIKPKATI